MKIGIRLQALVCSLIVFLLLLPVTYSLSPAYATESTPSSEIRSKLEELKKEIASKAAKLKETVNRKLKDKAYIGEVKSKSENTLTLATQSGPRVVNINQDTVFESNIKSQQKNLPNNITIDDYVATLGDSDETGVLTAKKIILLNPSSYTPNPTHPSFRGKTYLWGQIISISDQLATLKNSEFRNVAVSLPSQSAIKLNDFVILTGNKGKNNVFDAGFVYTIPAGTVLKPKKIATPSAQISTQSSKIKPSSR